MKNRFDTISLELPRTAIKNYNPRYFIKANLNINNGEIRSIETQDLHEIYRGFNSVKLTDEKCIIQISAKILGADYMQGITDETYSYIITYINNSDVIQIDESDFYHLSRFLKCHTADNIHLINNSISDYFTSLEIHKNPLFKITSYEPTFKRKNEGIQFKTATYSAKIYNKEFDMQRTANVQMLSDYPILKNEIKNIARFEAEHNKFKQMKERFDVPVLSWKNMLGSQVKVNSVIFNKIIQPEMKEKILHTFDRIHDAKQYIYLHHILNIECEGDLKKAEKYLKSLYSEKVKRESIAREKRALREFKEQLSSAAVFQKKGINTTELVKEIKYKIAQ